MTIYFFPSWVSHVILCLIKNSYLGLWTVVKISIKKLLNTPKRDVIALHGLHTLIILYHSIGNFLIPSKEMGQVQWHYLTFCLFVVDPSFNNLFCWNESLKFLGDEVLLSNFFYYWKQHVYPTVGHMWLFELKMPPLTSSGLSWPK